MDANPLLVVVLVFLAGVLTGLYLAYRFFGRASDRWHRQNNRYDQVIKLAIWTDDKRQGWFIELPERQLAKLRVMAGAVATGKELTGSVWSGHGKLFSRAEFETMVQLLLERDWVRWNNPEAHNQGLQVTRGGLAAFRFLGGIKSPHSPTDLTLPLLGTTHATYAHTRPCAGSHR